METEQVGHRSIYPEDVRIALRQIMDPEVGMNIVDLGLIYRIEITADTVAVDMTMTSPACPMGDILFEEVESALHGVLPADMVLNLQLVWEPPWSPEVMTEEARLHFGWEE